MAIEILKLIAMIGCAANVSLSLISIVLRIIVIHRRGLDEDDGWNMVKDVSMFILFSVLLVVIAGVK